MSLLPGPKMVAVQNYHGNPAPPGKPVLTFQIGDVIELLRGDPDSPWWEVRALSSLSSQQVSNRCHLHRPFPLSPFPYCGAGLGPWQLQQGLSPALHSRILAPLPIPS